MSREKQLKPFTWKMQFVRYEHNVSLKSFKEQLILSTERKEKLRANQLATACPVL